MREAGADRGTGQSNVCRGPRATNGCQQPLEAGEGHGAPSPSESPEGTHSAKIVESELLASTTVSEGFSVVLSHPLCGTMLPCIRELLILYCNYNGSDPGPGCFTD